MRSALSLLAAGLLVIVAWYQASTVEHRLAQLEALGQKGEAASDEPTLDDRLTTVESTVKNMSESFFNQATDVSELKQERDRIRKARLDLEEKTFSRVETQLGPLCVQAEAVRRKPDETAIDLLIGNPTTATLVNSLVRTRFGRAYEPPADFQLWQDGLKEREFTIKDPLRPGAWSRYTLHLETGPVTQVGFLEISIDTKTVLLQDVAETTTTTLPRPPAILAPRRPPPPNPVDDDKPEPEAELLDRVPARKATLRPSTPRLPRPPVTVSPAAANEPLAPKPPVPKPNP